MRPHFHKRLLKLNEINEKVQSDPTAFVREESERYEKEVDTLAEYLTEGLNGHHLILLSGPSSSGKTTTALKLRDRIREMGIDAHTISMDDFYRGKEQAPRLPDGTYDYEALEALRLDELERCMKELILQGCTMLPRFDFMKGKPSENLVQLCIKEKSVVIFEGIHAINPYFEQHLPYENIFKVFANTVTPIYDGDQKLVARRDIRLVRRMLRDERFRNSSVMNTLLMWQQVVRGENEYMFPFVDTVDYLIDTTHAYEPCLFAPLLIPVLRDVPEDHPYAKMARHLVEMLSCFNPIGMELMPEDSMLREFTGDGN